MTDNNLEPKKIFQFKIEKYYSELAGNKIPNYLLSELIEKITEIQHENYKRFWNQYPKSRKHYSVLKIEDLEHPFTYNAITNFLKLKDLENYRKYTMTLLKMTEKEFDDFELRKNQYETK
jgi:hypothetical protein